MHEYLIIINVTHIFVVLEISFNSGLNFTKCGRITKRRAVSNLAEPKFGFKVVLSEFLPLLRSPPYL